MRLTVIGAVAEAYLAERLAEEQVRLTKATFAQAEHELRTANTNIGAARRARRFFCAFR